MLNFSIDLSKLCREDYNKISKYWQYLNSQEQIIKDELLALIGLFQMDTTNFIKTLPNCYKHEI